MERATFTGSNQHPKPKYLRTEFDFWRIFVLFMSKEIRGKEADEAIDQPV